MLSFNVSHGMFVDVDNCSPSPCLSGATCVDGVDGEECICLPGHTGPVCETGIRTHVTKFVTLQCRYSL